MSLPQPILNFRVAPPVNDAFHVCARRLRENPGRLGREWLIERLVHEQALAVYRTVGLTEVLRRLAQPSPAFIYPDDSADVPSREGQTEANLVRPGRTPVGAER